MNVKTFEELGLDAFEPGDVVIHFEGVGWGARSFADGNNVVNIANGNCRNNPVEIFDHRYPFWNLSYRMIQDSGEPGRFRGGLGTERIVEVLAPEVVVSALFDRSKFPPWGVFGGKPGGTSEISIKKVGGYRISFLQ